MKLLKQGNAKLDKSIAVFNLPAVSTCGRACPGCYAVKAEKRFPAVKVARARNKAAADSVNFVHTIIGELRALGNRVKAVRVHESGDFYSEAYVAKWARIAKACPGLTFYAYTKRCQDLYGIGSALLRLSDLPNFIVINSLQYRGINYGTAVELDCMLQKGAFLCPCGGVLDTTKQGKKICGTSCTYCQTKRAQDKAPVFIKH